MPYNIQYIDKVKHEFKDELMMSYAVGMYHLRNLIMVGENIISGKIWSFGQTFRIVIVRSSQPGRLTDALRLRNLNYI